MQKPISIIKFGICFIWLNYCCTQIFVNQSDFSCQKTTIQHGWPMPGAPAGEAVKRQRAGTSSALAVRDQMGNAPAPDTFRQATLSLEKYLICPRPMA